VELTRGDVVILAVPGDYGKPRPAVVVQSDVLDPNHSSVIVCLMTTTLRQARLFRLHVEPTDANGLRKPSEIMIDKIQAVERHRIDQRVGALDPNEMDELDQSLKIVLGLD
jgi:mRNA interferase MazF